MRTPKSLFALLLLLLLASACREKPPAAAPTPKVQVVTVLPQDVPIYKEWIGTLDGYPNAQIRSQVAGYLMKQNYREGSNVKKGDLLFEIDARPFQAALNLALAKEQQDKALLGKSELDVNRFTPLAKTQAISQQQLDDAVEANLAAKAAVAADEAAVESAKLNLEFTRVVSPVDGIAGLAQAQIGDLVGPGSGLLTTVSKVNPIRVHFNVNEQFYLAFFRPNAAPGAERMRQEDIVLQLVLADNSIYSAPGKWIITGRQVDVTTGTLQVVAEFDNPENYLRPGQYARVRARTETRKGAFLVPQRAVMELQGAWQVAVLDATNTVHMRTIRVGQQIGSDWLIESGLQPKDRVVVEGTQKIKEGSKIIPEDFPPTRVDKQPGPPSAVGKGD